MIWEKLKEIPEKLGFRKVLHKTFRLPNGKVQDFTIKDERAAVCIFALTKKNEVIIAKQFRPGPEKILKELPGGGLEAGEDPQACAERELLEETGYAGKIKFIGTTLDCAYSNMLRYNFVSTECEITKPQDLDESEFIEVELMSISDFITLLRSGELSDVETGYLALDFLGLIKISENIS
jgi:ADP-ribose pyrophosphatase